eukprot:gene21628-22549_t
MDQTKSFLASKTIWGAGVALVATFAGLAGYSVSAADQSQALDLLTEVLGVWDRIAVIAGSALAIWGRMDALALLSLVKAVASFAAALTGWLHDRQLVNQANAAATASRLKEVIDVLDRANDARRRADSDADRTPERLHDTDGFRRD